MALPYRRATIVPHTRGIRSVPLADTTPVHYLFGNEIPDAIIRRGHKSKFGPGPMKVLRWAVRGSNSGAGVDAKIWTPDLPPKMRVFLSVAGLQQHRTASEQNIATPFLQFRVCVHIRDCIWFPFQQGFPRAEEQVMLSFCGCSIRCDKAIALLRSTHSAKMAGYSQAKSAGGPLQTYHQCIMFFFHPSEVARYNCQRMRSSYNTGHVGFRQAARPQCPPHRFPRPSPSCPLILSVYSRTE